MTEERQLEIRNATVPEDDGVDENVRHFWNNGTEQGTYGPQFNTSSIRYTPSYNEYRGAPDLVYENSVVAAEFPNEAVLFRSGQTVVRDNRISLTALTGDLSEDGVEPRSVDLDATSQRTRTIPIDVDNETEIVLPTATDNPDDVKEQWNDRLPGGVEAEADGNNDTVTISFEEEGEFRLRLAEVAVDGSESADAAYVVRVGPENVPSGVDVGVEVRDRFNNPVSDAEVTFEDPDESEVKVLSDDEGRAFFNTSDSGTYNASINGVENGDPPEYESVNFTVSAAGGGGDLSRTYDVQWDEEPLSDGNEVSGTVEAGDEPISNATVDFATNNPSIATFEGSNTNTTSVDGNFTTDLTVNKTGTVTLFAASGDDVDSTTVTVADETALEFAGNEQTGGDNIEFDIENVGTERTITAVAVDTDLAERFNRDQNTPEIAINGGIDDGELDTPGADPQALAADGTEHDLDEPAVLADGDTATVEIGDFENGGFDGFDGLTHTENQAEADITVTLVTDNGYFEFYFIDE